jgi:hypothetical protein
VDQAKAQVEEAASRTQLDGVRGKLQDQLQGKIAVARTQVAEASVLGKQTLVETRDLLQVALDETQQKAGEIAHQVAALLPQVIELEPILEELGFSVCNIDVTLSVTPGLAIIIEQQETRVGESLNALLGEKSLPLTTFQDKALRLLAKATDFAANITTRYGYLAQQYELTLLPPSVIIHFGAHDPSLISPPLNLNESAQEHADDSPPAALPDTPPDESTPVVGPDQAVSDPCAPQSEYPL